MTDTDQKITRTPEQQKEAEEIFDSFEEESRKRELSNTQGYDKAILTLSSAGLGFSLLAIRFIVPWESADFIYIIVLGWILLLASITISLLAYRVSNKAIAVELKNAQDYYLEGVEEAFNKKNKWQEWNKTLNRLMGILFVLAMFLIVIFVVLNISDEPLC